jgi:hypothetical protein
MKQTASPSKFRTLNTDGRYGSEDQKQGMRDLHIQRKSLDLMEQQKYKNLLK